MSLTYGYDLKDNNDQIIAVPVQATEFVSRLIVPGALLVNHLPFCAEARSVAPVPLPHQCLQCGTCPRGSHGLTTNHWPRKAENSVPG
jgi:hypothetical protein